MHRLVTNFSAISLDDYRFNSEPDGNLASVANFETIWVYDVRSGERTNLFSGPYRIGTNNTLVFIGNDYIASTGVIDSQDDSEIQAAIRIWNLKNSAAKPEVIALPELGNYSLSINWSRENGRIAVGGENGAVVLLEPNLHGNYEKRILIGLQGPVLDVEFISNGRHLAAGGDHPAILIWDTETGEEKLSLPVQSTTHDLDMLGSCNGLLVAGKELAVWRFQEAEELELLRNPSLVGDYIIAGSMVATMVVLAAISGDGGFFAFGTENEPNYGFCERMTAASPVGELVVDIHPRLLRERIRVLDATKGEVIESLNPRGGQTCGVAFSPDGKYLLIANNLVARLYDTASWEYRKLPLARR